MILCFEGSGLSARTLAWAAAQKGFEITSEPSIAELVFVSEDTPTHTNGFRELGGIRRLVEQAWYNCFCPVILTSQVPPGFTRMLGLPIYHQAETLRVIDAKERALYPEQHIVGCADPKAPLPEAYADYLDSFTCPVLKMTYEEAEFTKIAINMTLAGQVDTTNKLARAATLAGVDWETVVAALKLDGRIGPKAYLKPGHWQDSPHLLRDSVTLEAILSEPGH